MSACNLHKNIFMYRVSCYLHSLVFWRSCHAVQRKSKSLLLTAFQHIPVPHFMITGPFPQVDHNFLLAQAVLLWKSSIMFCDFHELGCRARHIYLRGPVSFSPALLERFTFRLAVHIDASTTSPASILTCFLTSADLWL